MKNFKKVLATLAGILILAGTAASQMLPDLTVNDVSLDDGSRITFELANESTQAVDDYSNGFVYVYIGDKVAWTYNWKFLRDTGFLSSEGNSVITSQIPKGNGDVKVCIDARDNVVEGDETNNCFEVEVDMEGTTTGELLPDLAVTDMFVNPLDGRLNVEFGNIGEGRPADYDGNLNVYVDGKLKWSYSFASMNRQFLNPGFTTVLQPNKFRGDHKVTACVSTWKVIDEVNKKNNCYTDFLSGKKKVVSPRPARDIKNNFEYKVRRLPDYSYRKSPNKPDFIVSELYREDGVVYAEISNTGEATKLDTATGQINFYLDGRLQREYLWNEFENLDFLKKNGSATLPVYEVMGAHEVQVCVDYPNRVPEQDENNNCLISRIR